MSRVEPQLSSLVICAVNEEMAMGGRSLTLTEIELLREMRDGTGIGLSHHQLLRFERRSVVHVADGNPTLTMAGLEKANEQSRSE